MSNTKHIVGEVEYAAELFHEEVGHIPPEFDTSCPFLELPTHVEIECKDEISPFFTNEKTVSFVNLNLESCHAVIDSTVKPQTGTVRIRCLLKKEMKDYQKHSLNWEGVVKKTVNNIISSLQVKTYRPIDKTWSPLKEKLKSCQYFEATSLLRVDDIKKEIKLIALAEDIHNLNGKIQKMMEEVTKDVESTDHEEEYDPIRLKYIKKNGILEKIKNLYPVKISDVSKPNCLKFFGSGADVLTVTRELRKEIERLHEAEVDTSRNMAGLLQNESFVNKFLSAVLKGAMIEVTGGNKVTLIGEKSKVNEVKMALKKSVKDSKVFFRSESKSLIGNPEWLKMLDAVENKVGRNKFQFHVNLNDLRIDIASLYADAKKVKEFFVTFFETHTVWKELVALPEGKLQIICSEFEKEMKSLPEKINSKRASVKISSNRHKGLILEGNKKELKLMRKEIDDLLSQFHMHKETVSGIGAKVLGQEMARHFRLSVEQECKVHVKILHNDSAKESYTCSKNGIAVKVTIGSMHECHADVLVDPANEELKHGGGLAKVLADNGT